MGASKDASSLYPSNASMPSINPYRDGLNASSQLSLQSVSSNVSMRSTGPSSYFSGAATTSDGDGLGGTDRGASKYASSLCSSNASMQSINPYGDGLNASSQISLQSVSSNASMGSMGPSGDFSCADRDASMYASSNASLRSASSNASMRSMNRVPYSGIYNPPDVTPMNSKAHKTIGKPPATFQIILFSDVPQLLTLSFTVIASWNTPLLHHRVVSFYL